MLTKDLRLELKPFGSILDCRIFLEVNDEIGLWAYNAQGKFYYKNLPSYPINGNTLDVKMVAKGKNGASTKLIIKIEGQDNNELNCIIQNGSNVEEKSITISNIN